MGLGRDPQSDPDDPEAYRPGSWWEEDFYSNPDWYNPDRMLLVPMDARTYGSWTSTDGYEYCSIGGLSWSVPWLAGLYALCVQKNPDITPELFIEKAFETGYRKTFTHDGENYTLGTIINPILLVDEF